MRILVIDDDRVGVAVTKKLLEKMGHEVTEAHSGESGLIKFRKERPDLVLTDLFMPGVDGHQVTRTIRSSCTYQEWVPIIFLTSAREDEDVEKGIEAGADDYLIKPVRPRILRAKIRAMGRITDMRNRLIELTARLESANESLELMTEVDALTQVYNRRGFDKRYDEYWHASMRFENPLSVLMMDIDSFKGYNDYYGHQQGDCCLQNVARSLRQIVTRKTDTLARYGGEEFVVLLPGVDEASAAKLAEDLRASVENAQIPHEKSIVGPYVTISIGFCTYIPGVSTISPSEVLKAADDALYEAKANGRNQVVQGFLKD